VNRTRLLLGAVLCLVGCGHAPVRRDSESRPPAADMPRGEAPRGGADAVATAPDPCAPTRVHLDIDYTPGGLYAPGVADGGPASAIDVSQLPEPVPHDEPRSRYGNRSPYSVLGKTYRVLDSAEGYVERGVASWYGTKFNGRATSSGEPYDICSFTAAHRTLPLPSYVRVTNLDNGRSVIVRVNDRGPFHSGRLIDLSYAAAVRLGVDRTGTAPVELRALSGADASASASVAPAGVTAARAPDPGLGPDDNGRRFLQFGSFADKDNAKRLADRLDDAGFDDVDLDHAEVDDQDVWRVRVGPVDAADIESLLARARARGLPVPRVFSQ
jgi:rare lipoprotein A